MRTIRAPLSQSEYDLHAIVLRALREAGLTARHEVALSPGRRIDFLCGDVGIEVKRERPRRDALLKQLSAYAESPVIGALVLVAVHPPALPDALHGKKLAVISLHRLWGIAV